VNALRAVRTEFSARYGGDPVITRAPGRVNLIGEHTDYNDGYVMPAAIGLYTYAAIRGRNDGRFRVQSLQQRETVEFDAGSPTETAGQGGELWSHYVRGVVQVLRDRGVATDGADLLVHGEVPLGSGLSSSAALEVAVAQAILELTGTRIPGPELAALCQRAENEYVGIRCGIMDQYTSACGRAEHALLLDCRALTHDLVPLNRASGDTRAACIVVCNTMVRHELAVGAYNQRRTECEMGVAQFRELGAPIASLRDVTPGMLARFAADLDRTILRRCRHVVHENGRVTEAAAAIRRGDLKRFGRLMGESHASLRDDYEVSCAELDKLVEIAVAVPGVYGSRMTGGGFGGCTVSLVRSEAVGVFTQTVRDQYLEATGRVATIHVCDAADGAGRVDERREPTSS